MKLNKLELKLQYDNDIKEIEVDLEFYNKEIERLKTIIRDARDFVSELADIDPSDGRTLLKILGLDYYGNEIKSKEL